MRDGLKVITFIVCLCAVTASGQWDEPHDFPDSTAVGRKIERRSPGWRNRARHADAVTELAAADRLRDSSRWRRAQRRYRAVVANWHDSVEAVIAQLRLAQMLEQRQRHERAFFEYQYLIDHYIDRFPYTQVLERQYELAIHMAEASGSGIFGRLSVDTPLAMLETLLKNAPHGDRAPSIKAAIGKLHERDGAYDLAATTYATLQQRHPGSPEAAEAAFREVRVLTRLSRRKSNDEALATETLALLRRYQAMVSDQERYKVQRYIDEVEQRVIAFWRERADLYDRIQDRPRAALIVYEEWLSRFPDMDEADEVRARIESLRKKVNE